MHLNTWAIHGVKSMGVQPCLSAGAFTLLLNSVPYLGIFYFLEAKVDLLESVTAEVIHFPECMVLL